MLSFLKSVFGSDIIETRMIYPITSEMGMCRSC
jgi:hypothetical protein